MPNWLKNKHNRSILFLTGGVLVASAICIWGFYTFVGKDNVLNWLLNEENRKLLTWIGSGCGVIVIGLWVAFVYFSKPR